MQSRALRTMMPLGKCSRKHRTDTQGVQKTTPFEVQYDYNLFVALIVSSYWRESIMIILFLL